MSQKNYFQILNYKILLHFDNISDILNTFYDIDQIKLFLTQCFQGINESYVVVLNDISFREINKYIKHKNILKYINMNILCYKFIHKNYKIVNNRYLLMKNFINFFINEDIDEFISEMCFNICYPIEYLKLTYGNAQFPWYHGICTIVSGSITDTIFEIITSNQYLTLIKYFKLLIPENLLVDFIINDQIKLLKESVKIFNPKPMGINILILLIENREYYKYIPIMQNSCRRFNYNIINMTNYNSEIDLIWNFYITISKNKTLKKIFLDDNFLLLKVEYLDFSNKFNISLNEITFKNEYKNYLMLYAIYLRDIDLVEWLISSPFRCNFDDSFINLISRTEYVNTITDEILEYLNNNGLKMNEEQYDIFLGNIELI